MQIARAPQAMAVEYKRFTVCGIATARVLGDIHDIKSKGNGVLDGFLCGLQQKVVRPAFGEAADGAGTDKGCSLDAQAGFLHDLGDRANIIFVGARRAIRLNLHLVRDDLARQRGDGFHGARTCSRQSEVEGVEAQRFHQMKDFNLFCNGRIAHRRRLQTVTQALVVE